MPRITSVKQRQLAATAPDQDKQTVKDRQGYIPQVRYSAIIGSPAGLLFTLNNPNADGTPTGDRFGYTVDISADRAVVGAYAEGPSGSGRAYIFDVTTGLVVHSLVNPNPFSGFVSDNFGWAVAIDGDRCVVSAINEDDGAGNSSGKVYCYNVTTGALVRTFNNANLVGTSANDFFGHAVDISGDRVIISAVAEDDIGQTDSGKVYVYSIATGQYVPLNNPSDFGTAAQDRFGIDVAIDGERCIVGADQEDDTGVTNSGKAYIFDSTDGTLLHTLDNPNPVLTANQDLFGSAVAIGGDYCAVGAYAEESRPGAVGTTSGKVYVYNVATGALLHQIDNPDPVGTGDGNRFGSALDISGNLLIVGDAFATSETPGEDTGRAYIFDLPTGSLVAVIENENVFFTENQDRFGFSVGISGDRCIIGAFGEDESTGAESGKAYIYSGLSVSLNEGTPVTVTVTTTNVSDGTAINWRVLDNPGDFVTASGIAIITNNTATFSLTAVADQATEGAETFRIELSKPSGALLAIRSAVTINDTSTG